MYTPENVNRSRFGCINFICRRDKPLLPLALPLPDGLEHEDGGRDRDVERIEAAEHGDAYVAVGGLAPLGRQSCGLRAHDDGRGLEHGGVVVGQRILELGREYLHAMGLQEGNALLGRAGHSGHREDGSEGGADEVGIVEVGERVAYDDGIYTCGIGRTEHGAEVAGLLHALQHHEEGCAARGGGGYVGQAETAAADLGDDALRGAAVGHTLVELGRQFQGVGCLGKRAVAAELGADEEGVGLVACLQAVVQFATALHDEEARAAAGGRLLLQFHELLDARILR